MDNPFPFLIKKLNIKKEHDELLCSKPNCPICKKIADEKIRLYEQELEKFLAKHPEIM